MLHGANGLGVAGEIRKGPCARNTLPVRARYTPMSVYISMTGKGFTSPLHRRAGTGMLTSHGEALASQAPNEKNIRKISPFRRLRHQRRRRTRIRIPALLWTNRLFKIHPRTSFLIYSRRFIPGLILHLYKIQE